jgi:hypothetical protein
VGSLELLPSQFKKPIPIQRTSERFEMIAVFTIFLTQVFAPIIIVVGIAGAFISRSWWHVLITALAAVAISEITQRYAKDAHIFNPTTILMGIIAAGLWAAWFYWLKLAKKINK